MAPAGPEAAAAPFLTPRAREGIKTHTHTRAFRGGVSVKRYKTCKNEREKRKSFSYVLLLLIEFFSHCSLSAGSLTGHWSNGLTKHIRPPHPHPTGVTAPFFPTSPPSAEPTTTRGRLQLEGSFLVISNALPSRKSLSGLFCFTLICRQRRCLEDPSLSSSSPLHFKLKLGIIAI